MMSWRRSWKTLGALKDQADSTGAMSERAMRELLVPEGHPSRHLVMGEPETVAAITREDLVASTPGTLARRC